MTNPLGGTYTVSLAAAITQLGQPVALRELQFFRHLHSTFIELVFSKGVSMNHLVFDPNSWFNERLSHLESSEMPFGRLISGAESAVSCDLTRNKFWNELVPDAETVPAHVFVWGIGESHLRHLTKIGGLPYWPKEEEWPLDVRGAPVPFLAQICFADSRQLFSFDLPGDVLLIFAESHRDSNRWVTKWQNVGLSDNELVDWNEVPQKW